MIDETRCAECGAELSEAEAKRANSPELKGSKYAGMCNDCCRVKAGVGR